MKTENKVSLEQVLWSREKRVATQKELLEKYPGTLICFMLNIPGPEKVNELFEKVFYEGLEKIQNKLETEKISTEVRLVQENITGYEGYLVVKADGCQVKKLMIALILMYWKKKIRKSAERILDFRKENVCYATTRPASVAEAENIRSKN